MGWPACLQKSKISSTLHKGRSAVRALECLNGESRIVSATNLGYCSRVPNFGVVSGHYQSRESVDQDDLFCQDLQNAEDFDHRR